MVPTPFWSYWARHPPSWNSDRTSASVRLESEIFLSKVLCVYCYPDCVNLHAIKSWSCWNSVGDNFLRFAIFPFRSCFCCPLFNQNASIVIHVEEHYFDGSIIIIFIINIIQTVSIPMTFEFGVRITNNHKSLVDWDLF